MVETDVAGQALAVAARPLTSYSTLYLHRLFWIMNEKALGRDEDNCLLYSRYYRYCRQGQNPEETAVFYSRFAWGGRGRTLLLVDKPSGLRRHGLNQ